MAETKSAKQARALRAKKQKILLFPKIALALNVVALLACFLPFVGIYNTDIQSIEIKVSGWNALFCGLTGSYTTPGAVYGNMDIFNNFATVASHALGLWGMIAMLLLVAALVLTLVCIFAKQPALCIGAFALNLVGFVMLVLAYRSGLAVSQSNILVEYCQSNPACSVESYATIPAVLLLVTAVFNLIGSIKFFQLKK